MNKTISAILSPEPTRVDLALLIARAATGLVVFPHGYFKLMGGVAGLTQGLTAAGLPAPGLLAWCATLAEFLGAALMVVGLVTRPAAASVAFTLVVAWMTVHLKDISKMGQQGGPAFEYPFLISMVALAIAIVGAGRYSLDAKLFGRR